MDTAKASNVEYGKDFTIEPLQKRSHGHKETHKPIFAKNIVMEPQKQFKNSEEIRAYWREHKAKQRTAKKDETK